MRTEPDPTSPESEATPRRPLESMQNLPRASSVSHFRSSVDKQGGTFAGKFPTLATFGPRAYWEFILTYASHIFRRRVAFPDASAAPNRSVYVDTRPEIHLAVAGDWGTGTDEAFVVARGLARPAPDYTIHLGDVYFIGDSAEIDANFLGVRSPRYREAFQPVAWPHGTRGTFSLNGNHEMYANGHGYFHHLLPAIGMAKAHVAAPHEAPAPAIHAKPHRRFAPPVPTAGQGCSFFCLQTERWLIVALDTGYNSRGLPFLSQLDPTHIPWLRRVQDFFQPTCKLPDALVDWLRADVRPLIGSGDAARGVILLSHHQYYSAFPEEFAYRMPAQQVREALGITQAVWLWGHEHRFAGYDLGGPGELKVHGRCLGHGGMPISTAAVVPESAAGADRTPPLRFLDNRTYQTNADGSAFGWNGYLKLDIHGPQVKARYFDIASIKDPGAPDEFAESSHSDRLLIEETFMLGAGGTITCETAQHCLDKDFYGPVKWG